MAFNPVAYHFGVGKPNKRRYYGLGSVLTTGQHLPRHESHDSAFSPYDDVGSDFGRLTQTPHLDKHLLHQIEELETHMQGQKTKMNRLQQTIKSKADERAAEEGGGWG